MIDRENSHSPLCRYFFNQVFGAAVENFSQADYVFCPCHVYVLLALLILLYGPEGNAAFFGKLGLAESDLVSIVFKSCFSASFQI